MAAPGSWILSVKGAQANDNSFWGPFNGDYAFMGGTSMATPLTAGAAAVLDAHGPVGEQGVDGPALVWFEIAEEQNVFPMMPAGKGLSDLIEKWGGADE